MGLALGQLLEDRPTDGIDEGVGLGGQPAARATHAIGSPPPFWGSWPRAGELGSRTSLSSGCRPRKHLIRLSECAPSGRLGAVG